MKVETVSIDQIKPYENNPRNNDDAVDAVANSIKEFGWQQPIVVDNDRVIIAGHTRYKAAKRLKLKEVPIVVADNLTEEQVNAYRLADNKSGELATWDDDELQEELDKILDIDMAEFGFDLDTDIDNQLDSDEIIEDSYEEEAIVPKAKLGQIYQLGRHRLMCGDSTDPKQVEKLMEGTKADMVFTDPPYGMKKEKDGVENDNMNYDDLLAFNKKWIPITFNNLKPNGSWYCWGIDEPLMDIYSNVLKPMIRKNQITFRNLITWDKKVGQGQMRDENKCYAPADEKCLFIMCGVQGFNNNSDYYYKKFDIIRLYLVEEANRVGLSSSKCNEITGTQMYKHWFSKSQWSLISKQYYKQLQQYFKDKNGFPKSYEDIEIEYKKIKKEFRATRVYFDNIHDNMNSVWHFDRVSGNEREDAGGHATPKPIPLCARAIKTSSRENEKVLDVFGGSGSTLIACEQINRSAYLMELEPHWVDVIIDRWEKFTGETAKLIQE